ncbi:uncharacterized protein MELLADRAFT_65615 [Melampsora larici-populina 98AG31]|uniref:S-methyl-5-thioribose-1-phosphate isomerase n=1 Tax=Melampsora larici-populina (strain 98AG31 / pathotype 3-4-7) TaxID=747676 RepID=F4RW30_MELLP|nr:uncharacterized protein MELLADRAFT_65615 [Melampsora larici-populina 98AG31]EGG03481.1 hypothetical protein MELLADRAFT_65615 [Melampsora larici-populina 98AG31]
MLCSIRIPNGKSLEETRSVEIIDQLILPHELKWCKVSNTNEAFEAIKSMKIRGAPAIGSIAALSIACELLNYLELTKTGNTNNENNPLENTLKLQNYLEKTSQHLLSARPTAVNLREALLRVAQAFHKIHEQGGERDPKKITEKLVAVCKAVWEEDLERNKKIGYNGARWLINKLGISDRPERKISMLTVCNTGSLATAGFGTALGVITALHELGRLEHAYYMQTGPYMQGARLTSLELQTLKIPSTMVCDTAAGWLINSGRVDAFVAGADRIASNGDTANKISTYQISLMCRHAAPTSKSIPVLIAAPLTTFDLNMESGVEIVIEERPSIEACTVRGKVISEPGSTSRSNEVATVLITPEGTQALNPAFDVTPNDLISGIVTELGVAERGHSSFDLREHAKGGSSHSTDGQSQAELQIASQVQNLQAKYNATAAAYKDNTGHDLLQGGIEGREPVNPAK